MTNNRSALQKARSLCKCLGIQYPVTFKSRQRAKQWPEVRLAAKNAIDYIQMQPDGESAGNQIAAIREAESSLLHLLNLKNEKGYNVIPGHHVYDPEVTCPPQEVIDNIFDGERDLVIRRVVAAYKKAAGKTKIKKPVSDIGKIRIKVAKSGACPRTRQPWLAALALRAKHTQMKKWQNI